MALDELFAGFSNCPLLLLLLEYESVPVKLEEHLVGHAFSLEDALQGRRQQSLVTGAEQPLGRYQSGSAQLRRDFKSRGPTHLL